MWTGCSASGIYCAAFVSLTALQIKRVQFVEQVTSFPVGYRSCHFWGGDAKNKEDVLWLTCVPLFRFREMVSSSKLLTSQRSAQDMLAFFKSGFDFFQSSAIILTNSADRDFQAELDGVCYERAGLWSISGQNTEKWSRLSASFFCAGPTRKHLYTDHCDACITIWFGAFCTL